MRSSIETGLDSSSTRLSAWNRKLHYYLGLYLLLFVWLFAFTGLLLNHSAWKFAEFWEQRRQTVIEQRIVSPPESGDLDQARDVMRQLGIHGEIDWTATRSDQRLDFRVSRPGEIFEIKTDLAKGQATIQRMQLNKWGVMRILHTFSGVRSDDTRNTRDWMLTSIWVITMDAVAAGMVFLVLTSLFLMLETNRKRLAGFLALILGTLTCGLFCVGLRWLY